MKHLESILWLLVLVLLGCGEGVRTSDPSLRPAARPILGPTSDIPTTPPPPQDPNIVSNWQFSTASTLTIAGSISQSDGSVSGVVHVDGSNCFNRMTAVGLTGTLAGGNVSLIATSVAGQVITLTGSVTDSALSDVYAPGRFTGTYAINGGCANGEQGNVTGLKIGYIANILNGTFTATGGETFDVTCDMGQNAASSDEGSFGITGTVTFTKACFSSGTITAGSFPSGSYIIGTSVAFVIETNNGTVAFLGTLNPDTSEITGDYHGVGRELRSIRHGSPGGLEPVGLLIRSEPGDINEFCAPAPACAGLICAASMASV
jgi:hypothetical protein